MMHTFDISDGLYRLTKAQANYFDAKKMKRTTTEILIEVEETVAVRLTEKTSNTEKNKSDQLTDELTTCPVCEQTINKSKHLENKGDSNE